MNAQPTLAEIETALDGHKLYLAMNHGKWWLARRNGKTKLWKRQPEKYEIPIKAGMFCYDRISQFWRYGLDYRIDD